MTVCIFVVFCTQIYLYGHPNPFLLLICYSHIGAAETLIFTTSHRSPNPMFPTFASPIVTVLQLQWITLSDFSDAGESVAFLWNKYIPIWQLKAPIHMHSALIQPHIPSPGTGNRRVENKGQQHQMSGEATESGSKHFILEMVLLVCSLIVCLFVCL